MIMRYIKSQDLKTLLHRCEYLDSRWGIRRVEVAIHGEDRLQKDWCVLIMDCVIGCKCIVRVFRMMLQYSQRQCWDEVVKLKHPVRVMLGYTMEQMNCTLMICLSPAVYSDSQLVPIDVELNSSLSRNLHLTHYGSILYQMWIVAWIILTPELLQWNRLCSSPIERCLAYGKNMILASTHFRRQTDAQTTKACLRFPGTIFQPQLQSRVLIIEAVPRLRKPAACYLAIVAKHKMEGIIRHLGKI